MRQTVLSLAEILNFLENGGHYPTCLLLNELGCICQSGTDQEEKAEQKLVEMLKDEDRGHRAIAFSWLSVIPALTNKHQGTLDEFRNAPENTELMPSIEAHLEAYRLENE